MLRARREDVPRPETAALQLHKVTWMDGRNRPMLMPEPRSIAWIARGVEMKRTSSAAAGSTLWSGRVIALHTPSACTPGPAIRTSSPVGQIVADRQGERRREPFITLCLLERRGMALEDPLSVLRYVEAAQHGLYDAVIAEGGGTEQPGLLPQLGRSGLDLGEGMLRPRHEDDLIVQKRSMGHGVGEHEPASGRSPRQRPGR